MKINIVNQTNYNIDEYRQRVKKIFRFKKWRYNFNLIFVTDDEIRQINRTYRNKDKATDVLSFALLEEGEPIRGAKRELGDIFVCLDIAKRQAEEYGHSILREVCFLTVHGYLHLNGYDHQNLVDENIMQEKSEKILKKHHLERGIKNDK